MIYSLCGIKHIVYMFNVLIKKCNIYVLIFMIYSLCGIKHIVYVFNV